MEDKMFIVWYVTDVGDEDYRVYHADDEIDAREQFRKYHDNPIVDCHEIDWNFQLAAD